MPALPLQLLLTRHPEWTGRPAAVVDRDTPQGRILQVDARARRRRIVPGMRYGAALALDGGLVAGVVEPAEVEAAVADLVRRLLTLTPGVEPAAGEPGLFFLDAAGLHRLWPSMRAWADAVLAALERPAADSGNASDADPARRPLTCRATAVTVGFTRFGTWATARTARGVVLFADPAAERRAAGQVPLARLGIDPDLGAALDRLGVVTVDDLARLPEGGLAERFGAAALRLHRLASDALAEPLTPERPREALAAQTELEAPDDDALRLLFLAKRLLDPLLTELERRGELLVALTLTLQLEDGSRRRERLAPARPTRDGAQLLELVRLRLEQLALPTRVEQVRIEADSAAPEGGQLDLFAGSRRDAEAAGRALARLRAELGEAAVVRARPADRWLPAGSFLWEPLAQLPQEDRSPAATSAEPDAVPLVRRIFTRARPLPGPPSAGDPPAVPAPRFAGPYRLSGGWWRDALVRDRTERAPDERANERANERDYYFAETAGGELRWIYLDRNRRRWFLQGTVT